MPLNPVTSAQEIPGIRPYFEMDPEFLSGVAGILKSGLATNNGPFLQEFERQLASHLGVSEAVVVSTGFDALLLSLCALSLPRAKVILPAYTYIATLNAVVHAGHQAIFCDIDPATFTMDVEHLDRLLKQHPETRYVIPVNVFGVPANLPAIQERCHAANAKLLYDNAHGFGSEVDGQRFQSEPEVQIFSLHATKMLPAVEGGFVVSENAELLATVKRLRNHGLGNTPAETTPGFNAKMDDLRAFVGLQSLKHFPESLARRRSYGNRLIECFKRAEDVYTVQFIPPGVETNLQNIGVCCPAAARHGLTSIMAFFKSRGIGVRPYFDPPLYKFKGFELESPLPVTETIWQTLISFPIHSRMTDAMLEQMETAIGEVAEHIRKLLA